MMRTVWTTPRLVVLVGSQSVWAGQQGSYIDFTGEGDPAGFYSP